jgi:hypothetical protein
VCNRLQYAHRNVTFVLTRTHSHTSLGLWTLSKSLITKQEVLCITLYTNANDRLDFCPPRLPVHWVTRFMGNHHVTMSRVVHVSSLWSGAGGAWKCCSVSLQSLTITLFSALPAVHRSYSAMMIDARMDAPHCLAVLWLSHRGSKQSACIMFNSKGRQTGVCLTKYKQKFRYRQNTKLTYLCCFCAQQFVTQNRPQHRHVMALPCAGPFRKWTVWERTGITLQHRRA